MYFWLSILDIGAMIAAHEGVEHEQTGAVGTRRQDVGHDLPCSRKVPVDNYTRPANIYQRNTTHT